VRVALHARSLATSSNYESDGQDEAAHASNYSPASRAAIVQTRSKLRGCCELDVRAARHAHLQCELRALIQAARPQSATASRSRSRAEGQSRGGHRLNANRRRTAQLRGYAKPLARCGPVGAARGRRFKGALRGLDRQGVFASHGCDADHGSDAGFPEALLRLFGICILRRPCERARAQVPVPVVYTDFLSQYSSVNVLMGLWQFATAREIRVIEDCREELAALLRDVTPSGYSMRAPAPSWPTAWTRRFSGISHDVNAQGRPAQVSAFCFASSRDSCCLFADLDDANREIRGSCQGRNRRTTGRILEDLDCLVAAIRAENVALANPRPSAVAGTGERDRPSVQRMPLQV
jgi:hypothetical protein